MNYVVKQFCGGFLTSPVRARIKRSEREIPPFPTADEIDEKYKVCVQEILKSTGTSLELAETSAAIIQVINYAST